MRQFAGRNGRYFLILAIISSLLVASYVVYLRSASLGSGREQINQTLQCSHWAIIRTCQLLGVPMSSTELIKILPYATRGHSMLQISNILKSFGMQTDAKLESVESLGTNGFPCIVHLKAPDHFVVVSGVDDHWIHVYDGSGHRTKRSKKIFNDRFGGEVLYIRRESSEHGGHSSKRISEVTDGPSVHFETLLVDKGVISPSTESISHYPIHNRGNSDLHITAIRPDCSCLRAEGPTNPIPPGGNAMIKLAYRVKSQNGPFVHGALIETNDPTAPRVLIETTGFAGAEVRISPPRLNLGDVVRDRPHTARVFVEFTGQKRDFEIEGLDSTLTDARLQQFSNMSQAQIESIWPNAPQKTDLGNHLYMVEVTLTPRDDVGNKLEGMISIKTNVHGYEQLSIPISAKIVSAVKAYPSILCVNKSVAPNVGVTKKVTLVSILREPFEILAVEPADGEIKYTFPTGTVESESEIVITATGIAMRRLCDSGVQVRIKLITTQEEVSVPVRLVALD